EKRTEEINKLEKEAYYLGTHDFYSAGKDLAEYPFEIAAEYNFICPQTGKPLKLIDKKKKLKEIQKKLQELKTEVEELTKLK
ncbi:MAG: hypothetical protein QXX06_00925, partial [Candidatus Diapherotrites archaeon]